MYTNNEPLNLMQIQVSLEESLKQRGAEAFIRSVNKAKANTSENNTTYGTTIIASMVASLAVGIEEFIAEASSGKAGVKHSLVKFIGTDIEPKQIAYIALKAVVAGISGANNVTLLATTIGKNLEDELRLSGVRKLEKRVYESIIKGTMKRGSQHYKHMYAVRRADYFNDGWVSWGRKTQALVGSKLLDLICTKLDLIEIQYKHVGKQHSVAVVAPKPATVLWLEKNKMAGFRSPYEPMVVRPRDWTTPFDGGYLTTNITPLKLVKRITPRRLNELYGNAVMPLVYKTVNELQHTAWQINPKVLETMQYLSDTGSTLGGIPSKAALELPPKPLNAETNAGAFAKWKRDASQAHRIQLESVSARIAFTMTTEVAQRFSEFKRIFFPYNLDFRGRIYAVPHINPQGSDFQKGLLRFSQGKPLGEKGAMWLAIHGANLAGVDKVSFQDRYEWVEDNTEEICAIAADPYNNQGWAKSIDGVEIDNPWQFLAFCFEWAGYCEQGDGFISHQQVNLDGSNSGLQHFSAALRDAIGGKTVCLVPAEVPADVYQEVATAVLVKVKADLVSGTEDSLSQEGYVITGTKSLAEKWITFGMNRKTVKRSVMCTPYGSKSFGFKENLLSDILNPAQKAMGDAYPFGKESNRAAIYLAAHIWEAVTTTLVAAGQAMRWIKEVGMVANKDRRAINWVTPAGFPVEQSYISTESLQVETHINGRIRLRLDVPTDTLDLRRCSSALSPNIVHSWDSAHLMMTVCEASSRGINSFAMIHDSFGTHACDTDTLFATVRETFVKMYKENDVLAQFKEAVSQSLQDKNLIDELPDDLPKGDLDLDGILLSKYAFA